MSTMMPVLPRPFDLEIEVDSGRDALKLRVSNSPGGPLREFVPAPNPLKNPQVQKLLQAVRQAEISTTQLRELGSLLSCSLIPGEIGRHLRYSLHQMADLEVPLRLRLFLTESLIALSGDESLIALPWELAYDDEQNSFLAVDPRLSVIRVIRTTALVRRSAMAHDIGVLIGISQAPSSSDSSTLALVGQLYSELERMPPLRALPMPTPATIQALIEKLRGSVNVLHLYTQAHASGRQVTISLQAEDGKNATIDSKTFSHVLRGSSVPLAILSTSGPADDPSSPDETHALLEFALQLVVAGTPAVLAVPTTLSERTGQLFWQEFYRSIVQRGQPLDLALGAGRMALWQRRELTQSWYMPTLFAAADEDALWPFGQYGPAASAQQQWIKSLP